MNKHILYIWVVCNIRDGKAKCGAFSRPIEIKNETAKNIILLDCLVKHLKHSQLMVVDSHFLSRLSDHISYHMYCRPEDKERALEILFVEVEGAVNRNYLAAKAIKEAWDSQSKTLKDWRS